MSLRDDEAVLRNLLRSATLTVAERAALGRLLGAVGALGAARAEGPLRLAVVARRELGAGDEREDPIEEERRQALLGPCGAQ